MLYLTKQSLLISDRGIGEVFKDLLKFVLLLIESRFPEELAFPLHIDPQLNQYVIITTPVIEVEGVEE